MLQYLRLLCFGWLFVAGIAQAVDPAPFSVHLPFVPGSPYRCTQNSNDGPTHDGYTTKHDLDFGLPVGTTVVAAHPGVVRIHRTDADVKSRDFGWHIQLEAGNGYFTMYGHLSEFLVSDGARVAAGQAIARSGGAPGHNGAGTSGAPHLHFGIHKGDAKDDQGKQSVPMEVFARNVSSGKTGFFSTDSVKSKSDFKCDRTSTSRDGDSYAFALPETRSHGAVAWFPSSVSCENADRFWKEGIPTNANACLSIAEFCATQIIEGISETGKWHESWWRYFRGLFNALPILENTCRVATVIRTLTLNTDGSASIAGGVGGGLGDDYGQGYSRPTPLVPVAPRPDFVVKDVRLHTPWGPESYKYGLMESFNTKAQSGNTGEGSCLAGEKDTIIGHFYLSKGYKEDAHGDWKKVDSTETKCSNLKPGDTNTETKNTVISDWIQVPGIYNIVYCIDHPKTEQNDGGDHAEKHESNNCSTEAVFEVTGNSYENTTNIDLVTSGLQFRGTPPVYAADSIRLGAWITNAGTQGLYTDIRSSYGVSCNGSPPVQLADDGTEAKLLGPGMVAFEEILSPVTLPNVSGSCVATFCADHAYMVNEVDKVNNCTSLNFNLAVRPQKPILSITKFQDEESCCTTNTGSKIKPNIWVRNSGPVAPATNVQVVYHLSSPVATGNLWIPIGTGIIEPRELPPGKTDEDYMDGSFTIPSTAPWKLQWHQVRACIKPDGSAPSGDPTKGDICATYQRYSKK